MSKPYQVLPPTAPVPAPDDVLETLVREGARKMLQDALEAGVDDFLRRRRYPRSEVYRGCLNGHLHERTIGVGMGAVEIRARLVPSEFVVANGRRTTDRMPHADAPLQLLRFMLLGRRRAGEYLAKHTRRWPLRFDELVDIAAGHDERNEVRPSRRCVPAD